MLDKVKRRVKPNIQDRLQPTTVEELIRKYDLENKSVYDYLDKMVDYINNLEQQVTQGKEIVLSEILWENKTPFAIMAEDIEIVLSSNDYDYLEWFFIFSNAEGNLNNNQSISCQKGCSVTLFAIGYASNSTVRRIINYESDTKYRTQTAKHDNEDNNSYCIPIKVVGYKKLIKI